MIREKIMKMPGRRGGHFVWRNHEILRIEAFSDAVFAFALTLTIVSLEVPKTFHELLQTMTGMFGFAICYTFLLLIWYKQYLFFRYFGLRDVTTILLNAILLFVVLCYVYPLKFLFSLFTVGTHIHEGEFIHPFSSIEEVPQLMVLYCCGFIAVYVMLFFLYQHAWRKRDELFLNRVELFNLKTQMLSNLLLAFFGLLAIVVALQLPPESSGMAGFTFTLIGPGMSVFFSLRHKSMKKILSTEELTQHAEAVERSKKKTVKAGE
ncbi:MAG TPA: hypothetical protein DCQ93_01910 [Bacteroidetes bacterium]|nr:hypothetical protein [Bacteroidota bacterium]